MKTEYRFYMSLSREKYLRYYAGEATTIQVKTVDGIKIQFPASAVQPWITHQGINGYFLIRFDNNYKLIELKKLG